MIDVALMGCGRWGSRLLSLLLRHPRMRVRAVIDTDPAARARARDIAPRAKISDRLNGDAEALLIATPPALHARHAIAAIDAGYDVLVEKPLATSTRDADALCERIARSDRIGVVGHVLRYHPLVCDFVARVRRGDIGTPADLRARRFTSSGAVDPLWTLAPHDLATLRAIDDSDVTGVTRSRRDDIVRLELALASGLRAAIELSTHAARGERCITIEGSRGSVHFDELRDDSGANPLQSQLDHFVDCVVERRPPLTSFEDARWIVATLERAAS